MDKVEYACLIDLACAVAWVMVWLPCVIYIGGPWRKRRRDLFEVFGAEEIKSYYRLILPSVDIQAESPEELQTMFRKRFSRLYGRRWYLPPILLLAFVAAIGAWGTARTIQTWTGTGPGGDKYPAMVVSAFLGALIWVVYDQLTRLRDSDLTSHDVYNCVLRFLLAVPFAYALAAFAGKKNDVAVASAFLVGTFPTGTLFTLGRRLVAQKWKLGEQRESQSLELEKLQCIGRSNAERFMDEGFTTISQLAWCDPVDLTIRTNFDFNYVLDCAGQALVWVYFTRDAEHLYKFSLRGAYEAANLMISLRSLNAQEREAAEHALSECAQVLHMSAQTLYHALRQIEEDPYSRFLVAVWPWP